MAATRVGVGRRHHQFLYYKSYVIGLISNGTLYITGSDDPQEFDFSQCGRD